MKITLTKNLKVIGISAAIATVVLGLGLGVGLGVGLNGSNGSSDSPEGSNTKSLDFSIQNVNSLLGNVLAVNITDDSNVNFANFAFLQNSNSSTFTLRTDNATAVFAFRTGESNVIYNGFGNGGTQRLYLPIIENGVSEYLIIQKANTDDQVNPFLYVEGIGEFTNGTNVFNSSFSAVGLNQASLNLNLTFNIGTPTAIPKPLTESFKFTKQDVNTRLGGVLAMDVTDIDTTYFSSLAYVTTASPTSVSILKADSESAAFSVSTGQENILYNGFTQNGHLYLPIVSSDSSGNDYLEIEDAISDDSNSEYLYVDGVGSFGQNDNFNRQFLADDLAGDQADLDLTLSTDGSPASVPQPTGPTIKEIDFSTLTFNSAVGNVLHSQIEGSYDISNLLYVESSDPVSITFSGQYLNPAINLTILTGSSNLISYNYIGFGVIYVPIAAVNINGSTYNYLSLVNTNGVVDNNFYFNGLANSPNATSIPLLNFLNNSPKANIKFAEGN